MLKMMDLKISLVLLVSLHLSIQFGFEDVETIVEITQHTVSTLAKVPEIADLADTSKGGGVGIPFSKVNRQLLPMFKKFTEVTQIVQKIDRDLKASNLQTMSTLQRNLPLQYRYQMKLDSIEDTITLIDLYHQNFLSYIDLAEQNLKDSNQLDGQVNKSNSSVPERNLKFEQYTLENFAASLTAHVPTSVRGLMERIHEMIVPSSNDPIRKFLREGLFQTMLQTFDELESSICSTEMSPQQLIYNLYSTLQVTQLKAFVMMQFAYHLLHVYGKGDFSHETSLLQDSFKQRLVQQLATAKAALAQADNMLYKCDPRTHVEGTTYTQLTALLQGYIVNEVDLNGRQTCADNCASYPYATQRGCFDNQYCARQRRCEGTLVNCRFYDADMTICPASDSVNATRRYEWIEYENGITLGRKSHCKNFEEKVDSWWRFVYHCSYCMCLCDAKQSPLSHRYWSLRPVETDVDNNKVMVGLRFVKKNKVMYLQIRQAKLLPKLLIDTPTAEWLPIEPMEVSDHRTVVGLDYHQMTFEKRALDLDDLTVPQGHVLTGVQFRVLGNHLNMEIRATPFDYRTGQLAKEKSRWLGNDNTDANIDSPRSLLRLEGLDVPTASSSPSLPDSLPDSYLLFTHSDLNRDVAQSTLPYIDIQPVSPEPLTPLAGAGLYHKGVPGYGGFLAPRLYTMNKAEYLAPGSLGNE